MARGQTTAPSSASKIRVSGWLTQPVAEGGGQRCRDGADEGVDRGQARDVPPAPLGETTSLVALLVVGPCATSRCTSVAARVSTPSDGSRVTTPL